MGVSVIFGVPSDFLPKAFSKLFFEYFKHFPGFSFQPTNFFSETALTAAARRAFFIFRKERKARKGCRADKELKVLFYLRAEGKFLESLLIFLMHPNVAKTLEFERL